MAHPSAEVHTDSAPLEDPVSRLQHPVEPSSLDCLVRAARANEMDLCHLLLRVEMPPEVGDMTLAEYVRDLEEAASEAFQGLDGTRYNRLLSMGADALNTERPL